MRVDIPGEDQFLTPPHQDIYSYRCEKTLRLWVPLRGASKDIGTMKVYPGSHKLGYVEPVFKENPTYPEIDNEVLDNFKKLEIVLDKGDAILFNPLLIHGSVPGEGKSVVKLIAGFDIFDLTTVCNPDDPTSFFSKSFEIVEKRKINRQKTQGSI